MEAEPAPVYVAAPDARRLVHGVLEAHCVPAANAAAVAACLVAADLRGVSSHGVGRLPSYAARVRRGVLDGAAQPAVMQATPVAAVDGRNGFGAVAAARVCGVGVASVRRSNHFGMSAWLVQQALGAGMMSLVFTNSSPAMPAWGARSRLLGVSPIAGGAPGRGCSDLIVDLAPSVAARGKIYQAQRRRAKIPRGWALDAGGRPTDDPAAALAGVMLPIGGPKGSALSIMMDVFSGVFSGSAFAGHVTNPHDPSRPADVGHFLVAIKPDLFMSLDEFRDRMHYLYHRVVSSDKAGGVERVYFPGEREKTGIPLVQAELDALNQEAINVSVSPLVPLTVQGNSA